MSLNTGDYHLLETTDGTISKIEYHTAPSKLPQQSTTPLQPLEILLYSTTTLTNNPTSMGWGMTTTW